MKKLNQSGFTIIEMMIATSIFSVILLTGSMMIIQIGRMYYRGVVASSTQETARGVIDEISRPIQLEGAKVTINPAAYPQGSGTKLQAYAFCVGEKRFSYTKTVRIDKTKGDGVVTQVIIPDPRTSAAQHALWVDNRPDSETCEPANLTNADPNGSTQPDGVELLGERMMLSDFSIKEVMIGTNKSYALRLLLVNGDDDLLEVRADSLWHCRGNIVGSQWCGESDLQTNIYKRIELE